MPTLLSRAALPALATAAVMLALPASAQVTPPEDGTPVDIGHRFTIQSDSLGEERPVLIGLPAGCDQTDQPFPVLYLLDGARTSTTPPPPPASWRGTTGCPV